MEPTERANLETCRCGYWKSADQPLCDACDMAFAPVARREAAGLVFAIWGSELPDGAREVLAAVLTEKEVADEKG